MEKFEIKSQLYNTYFPPPERIKSKHEQMEEQRVALGLQTKPIVKKVLQPNDIVSRGLISKIKSIGDHDLEKIQNDQVELNEDVYSSSTKILGEELKE